MSSLALSPPRRPPRRGWPAALLAAALLAAGAPACAAQDVDALFDEEIELLGSPEQADADERPALWPFSPDDHARILGKTAEALSPKANDPLAFWTWAIHEFTDQRRSQASLNQQQELLLDELQQLRTVLSEASLSLPEIERRAKLGETLVRLQDNEEKNEQVENAVRDTCRQVAARAPEIRKRLGEVKHILEREGAPRPASGPGGQGKAPADPPDAAPMDSRRYFEYRQKFDAAIALLGRVEKAPGDAVGLLTANMKNFRAYRPRRAGNAPILTRFQEQITSLERSQKLLQMRMEANDREIKALRDLLSRTLKRMQELSAFVDPALTDPPSPAPAAAAAAAPAQNDAAPPVAKKDDAK